MISKRLQGVDSSAIRNALNASRQSDDLIDLSVGFPSEDTSENIKKAAVEAIDQGYTRYTPANGIPELRQAVAEKLSAVNGIEASKDTVAIVPGLTTGILLTYLAMLDSGDEVIIADPYFPPYESLATVIGARAKAVDTYPDFRFTAEKIEPHINSKTKLLVINSPNNPTGVVYTEAELRDIAELAAKHNLTICSDEVYECFDYEDIFFSIGSIYPNTITMNSFSKSYSMTGWRVGYINAPLGITEAINELLQYAVFSSSSVGQMAALEAIKKHPALKQTYRTKRNMVKGVLSSHFEIDGMQGGFFSFFPVPSGLSDMDFLHTCLNEGAMLLPGSTFSSKATHVRLSYGVDEKTLESGLSKINDIIVNNLSLGK